MIYYVQIDWVEVKKFSVVVWSCYFKDFFAVFTASQFLHMWYYVPI